MKSVENIVNVSSHIYVCAINELHTSNCKLEMKSPRQIHSVKASIKPASQPPAHT